MSECYNILIIEDSLEDAELYKIYLTQSRLNTFNFDLASTGNEGLRQIDNNVYSCIILDMNLPDMTGKEYIEKVNMEEFHTPIIIITGNQDVETGQEMLQFGISNYLDKSEISPASLERSIIYAIERNKMYQELKMANSFKEKFLAEFANEIKQPLENMIEYCDACFNKKYENASPAHLVDIMEYINNCAKKQKDSIDNIMSKSLISQNDEKISLTSINLTKEIEKCSKKYIKLAKDKGVNFRVDPIDPSINITLDKEKLFTSYECLLDNALKFTERGSIIIKCLIEQNALNLMIKDTGIGIRQSAINKIFSPYTHADHLIMRKYGGLGNGLAIAKEFIQYLGGTLTVKSNPSEGSEFIITIPFRVKSSKKNKIGKAIPNLKVNSV